MDWYALRTEWEGTDLSLVELANKHDIKVNTIRSRKNREGWEKIKPPEPKKSEQVKKVKKAAAEAVKERIAAKVEVIEANKVVRVDGKKAGQLKPATDAPWLQYLPEETLTLLNEMEMLDPLDVLYDQIRLQWAMIIRSQEIMLVVDKDDTTKFISNNGAESTGYDIHAAWDKQGKFMQSMSAAQKELRYLIQQFMDLVPVDDERRARVANIEANTELVRERTKLLKGNTKDPSMLNVLIDAMTGGEQNG